MARIENCEVFGLESSIFRSGYPMRSAPPDAVEFKNEVNKITVSLSENDLSNPHIKRAMKLGTAKGGGHDQFLTGIVVNFDLTLSNKAWVEAERYTFLNFISSMSTMHRISKMDIRSCCREHVHPMIINAVEALRETYNSIDGDEKPELKKAAYLDLLYNLPSGFEVTAAMTTNYRCLKNMYFQRKNHRLPEWHQFCEWAESLPLFKEICIGGNEE